MQSNKFSFYLSPESGVQVIDGKMVARALPVWLRLVSDKAIKSNRCVRIRYRSSIFDENVRPLIRFTTKEHEKFIQPMNGPLFGVGEWIGYIPKNVSEISISPVARTGPFDFRIEQLDYISPIKLLLGGALINPRWKASTPLAKYDRWSERLSRSVDLNEIDSPRADWIKTSNIRLFISADGATAGPLQSTVRSLLSQLYPRWSLHYLIDEHCTADQEKIIRQEFICDDRISRITDSIDLADIADNYSENDFCAAITAGDLLPNYALATVAEYLAQYPTADIIYGDEDSISSSGKLHTPILRPDGSPYFYNGRFYIDRPIWMRARNLRRAGCIKAGQFLSSNNAIVESSLADSTKGSVHHIRRVLYRRGQKQFENTNRVNPVHGARPKVSANFVAETPEVSIILLSRDNADCLFECINGLIKVTDYPHLSIKLVDNGSVKPDAMALLRDLKLHPQIDVLERPGPFNYSALCNEAARTSQAPILVFLNDDIAMFDPGWLKPLVYWALRPDVGIVGAKLLFPNGRIQHSGVIVGLGGIAGHLYRGQEARQVGYLEGLSVAHEVTAVTGACAAISRQKFESVGGFDAVNLPVELNDIDLCLRLFERGLATIWTPESILIHHESATRGRISRPSEIYRAERAYFVPRWQSAIRDDQFFHPSLSLFSYIPALA